MRLQSISLSSLSVIPAGDRVTLNFRHSGSFTIEIEEFLDLLAIALAVKATMDFEGA